MITATLDRKGWSASPYLTKNMTFDVPYIVETTSLNEGPDDIRDSGQLPQYGSPYPGNPYLAAFDCTLERDSNNPLWWRAKVKYKGDSLSQEERDRQVYPDPRDRPARVRWNTVSYDEIATKSVEDHTLSDGTVIKAGTPITNSALERYENPPSVTEYFWTVQVTKNVPAVPLWIMSMAGRVNNAAYSIRGITIAANHSRLIGLSISDTSRDNGFEYYELDMTIEIKESRDARFVSEVVPPPYILELLDQGFHRRFGKSLLRLRDAKGNAVTQPVPLDGSGIELANPTEATMVYRQHKVIKTGDFSQLPLT